MMRAPRIAFAVLFVVVSAISVAGAIETPDLVAEREHRKKAVIVASDTLAAAERNLDTAQVAYQNMRHRRSVRGDEKRAILDAVANAEAKLIQAQEALDAATVSARRAGVLPGWFRRQTDALPGSKAP